MNKKFNSNFKSKPSYDLYFQLYYILDTYLMTRIDIYIFLRYYKWNISSLNFKKFCDVDLLILRRIYEYDYQVFKVLLFLYWDLEYYLENDLNYINDSLDIVTDHFDELKIIKIKFRNKIKSNNDFIYKLIIN